MNKTKLSTAVALCLGAASSTTYAIDVDISNMDFNAIYLAEGQLRDNADDFGSMQSIDLFVGNPWSAVAIAYFEAGNQVPTEDNDTASDEASITNGTVPATWGAYTQTTSYDAGTDMYTWSGTSLSGNDGVVKPFSFTFALAADQVAWGTLFNWNTNQGIPVLNVMDCTDPAACAGVPGTPMVNGPFGGADPLFNGGLPPVSCVDSFHFSPQDTVEIDIATSLTEACSNPQGPVTLVSYGTPVNGGSVTDDGTTLTYTPPSADYNGPDSFSYTATDGVAQASANYLVQIGGELESNFTMMDTTGLTFGGTNDVVFNWDETSYNSNAVDAKGIPTDTTFGLMSIGSPYPFFNFNWTAHNVRVFEGPGTFKFDVTCLRSDYESGVVDCNRPLSEQGAKQQYMTMTLAAGQVGGHILFDWGKVDGTSACGVANCNIDVVNVWNQNVQWDDHGDTAPKNTLWTGAAGVPPATDANWRLVSTDFNGDGVNASQMVDGAFVGSYANFNYKPDKVGTALPPYTGQITPVDIDSFSINPLVSLGGLLGIFGLRRLTSKK